MLVYSCLSALVRSYVMALRWLVVMRGEVNNTVVCVVPEDTLLFKAGLYAVMAGAQRLKRVVPKRGIAEQSPREYVIYNL